MYGHRCSYTLYSDEQCLYVRAMHPGSMLFVFDCAAVFPFDPVNCCFPFPTFRAMHVPYLWNDPPLNSGFLPQSSANFRFLLHHCQSPAIISLALPSITPHISLAPPSITPLSFYSTLKRRLFRNSYPVPRDPSFYTTLAL